MGFTMTLVEIIRYLESLGFRRAKGGRHQIHMTKGSLNIAIPSHSGEIAKGTLSAILREIGSSTSEAKKWKHGD
ncbi:hypothetical protein FACS1894187_04780 [Synergistales bacterium]|nr:hypothetical protein FACS1894187_04780 [Synergistales bacterium]